MQSHPILRDQEKGIVTKGIVACNCTTKLHLLTTAVAQLQPAACSTAKRIMRLIKTPRNVMLALLASSLSVQRANGACCSPPAPHTCKVLPGLLARGSFVCLQVVSIQPS